MAQFDVHQNPNAAGRAAVPYVISLQSDLLNERPSVVVAPLVPRNALRPADRLNPMFRIGGLDVVMSTTELATLPRQALRDPVANVASQRDAIIRALDLLFTGV